MLGLAHRSRHRDVHDRRRPAAAARAVPRSRSPCAVLLHSSEHGPVRGSGARLPGAEGLRHLSVHRRRRSTLDRRPSCSMPAASRCCAAPRACRPACSRCSASRRSAVAASCRTRAAPEPRIASILSETLWRALFGGDPNLHRSDHPGRGPAAHARRHHAGGFPVPALGHGGVAAARLPRAAAGARTNSRAPYVRWTATRPTDDVAARATEVVRAIDPMIATGDGVARSAGRATATSTTSVRSRCWRRASGSSSSCSAPTSAACCSRSSRRGGASTACARRSARRARGSCARPRPKASSSASWASPPASRSPGRSCRSRAVSLPDALLLRSLNPVNLDVRALLAASIAGVVGDDHRRRAAGLDRHVGRAPAALAARRRTRAARRRARRASRHAALLVTEIALACTLLVGATLLVRSFVNLSRRRSRSAHEGRHHRVGRRCRRRSRTRRRGATIVAALEKTLRELPGVQKVALSFGLPPSGGAIHFGDGLAVGPARRTGRSIS